MRETSVSSVWWNSSVTSFLPVAHWDTLDSGISNAVLSLMSNDRRGPAGGDAEVHDVDMKSPRFQTSSKCNEW